MAHRQSRQQRNQCPRASESITRPSGFSAVHLAASGAAMGAGGTPCACRSLYAGRGGRYVSSVSGGADGGAKQNRTLAVRRVERLPLAVAAQLLQDEFGPLEEAARGLELSKLCSAIHDVPGLLERTIQSQGEAERQLLAAAAVVRRKAFGCR